MSETLIGSLVGGVVVIVGGIITWITQRGKTQEDTRLGLAQIDEQRRQKEIDLIIDSLKEQVTGLRAEVDKQDRKIEAMEVAHDAKTKALEAINAECLADRDQMRGEIRRLKDRVQELEKQGTGGC